MYSLVLNSTTYENDILLEIQFYEIQNHAFMLSNVLYVHKIFVKLHLFTQTR